jgi:hypothetical protein
VLDRLEALNDVADLDTREDPQIVQFHDGELSPVAKQCISCHGLAAAQVAVRDPQPLS